jgi:sulfur-oxidizing protein SoxZ
MAINILVRFNPAKPKAGDEVRVQIVVQHPMEPGTRPIALSNKSYNRRL